MLYTPIHLAASNALARYLTSCMPDVVIDSRWPDPDKALPNKAITIIPAGKRILTYMDFPQLVRSEDTDAINKVWYYRIAECEQPFQMDIWSHFPLDRDDIVARLDQFLNVGCYKLSTETALLPVPLDVIGLVLELSDGWEGSNAAFYFEDLMFDDTPDQTTRQEYRATYSGNGYFNLLKKVVAPTLIQANVKIKFELEATYTNFTP